MNEINFDKLMQDRIGVDVFVAEDAISCVAIGTGRYIEQLDSGRIGAAAKR